MGNLSNDGHHATASVNDLSTTSIVNDIYLLGDSGSNPFNSWMEKIGSRLHLASDQISVNPIVDFLITAISSERIFVINHKGDRSIKLMIIMKYYLWSNRLCIETKPV